MDEILDKADEWSRVFKLMGDSTRLRLMAVLHDRGAGNTTVTQLAELTGVRVATASAALRAMEHSGVVSSKRDGREVRYTLEDDSVHRILHHVGFHHADHEH
ncbi:transcriptional regulatory protein [Corynebacterium renale]|uniref:DNA-binding transcriptional ArsR family regulator n=1 Tax=Corynebacterium renale TaxID=1724 RepID=A0A2A9DNC6_9CORY|nr:metalloregulator ArsR/SmtB family transcription factor [Corynebacterium renale]PFG27891.1 DNA-binding transcriptional ArsR family regulator [Corynebacterium renale]SQG63389.1 transcriptional regulatory protein [Corynebacterium renale]SQI21918.1 transcriptional regulatory protein [Corynebacterium renale]STC99878.1 transcriptional regulatory protein [Corynebacterium renale]